MRYRALSKTDRVQLDADPDWAEGFLGRDPLLDEPERKVSAFFWTVRNATDPMAPIDLERSLALAERLHVPWEPRFLVDALQRMDSVYLGAMSEQMKRKTKEK